MFGTKKIIEIVSQKFAFAKKKWQFLTNYLQLMNFKKITLLFAFLAMSINSFSVAYEYVCAWTNAYGIKFEIRYDGTQCGKSSSWKGYKLVDGQWHEISSSSTGGEINLGDFSCCNNNTQYY